MKYQDQIFDKIITVKLAAAILPESGNLDLDKVKVLLAQVSAWATRCQLYIARCEAAEAAERKILNDIAG